MSLLDHAKAAGHLAVAFKEQADRCGPETYDMQQALLLTRISTAFATASSAMSKQAVDDATGRTDGTMKG